MPALRRHRSVHDADPHAGDRGRDAATHLLTKVPEITVLFWVIKHVVTRPLGASFADGVVYASVTELDVQAQGDLRAGSASAA